ncbi:hypothetical protein EJB05_34697, partial [Eragrostis curvula]
MRERVLSKCGTGNPIDDCWRCDPNWADNRTALADCAVGFGSGAVGGKNGKFYVVITDAGDDPADPAPGTLRHGVAQEEPLWITFVRDMTIRPKQDLLVRSHKTVDGRGAAVVVGDGGACLMVHNASNIIVHGITIRNCKPSRLVTSPASATDMSPCSAGPATDDAPDDKDMRVTVAFNRFGPDLVQRMPRCRFGLFHVINNHYIKWKMYAIGGSASPTILSQGNRFLAGEAKEVTKREEAAESEWSKWNWISEDDMMLNGAFFRSSGSSRPEIKAPSFAKPVSSVPSMTGSAGALSCNKRSLC